MLGWVEEGCLHGPVFLLSEDRRLLFSGFFHNGRPQGWIAAASPSPNGGHGLLFLKMEDGRHQGAVYLDQERACRGTYNRGRLLDCTNVDLKSHQAVYDCHMWSTFLVFGPSIFIFVMKLGKVQKKRQI